MTTAKLKWNQATMFQKVKRLLTALGDVAGDEWLKRDLAEFTKAMVYKRTKAGKGVTSDRRPFALTQHQRLKPLSKNYKRYRRTGIVTFKAKRKGKRGKVEVNINVGKPALGEFASPDRSNLTLTNQLLGSMTFDIRKFGFTILIPETKRRGETLTNAKLAKFVSNNGRPFMNLTSGESRIVQSRMRKQIKKRLNKLLR